MAAATFGKRGVAPRAYVAGVGVRTAAAPVAVAPEPRDLIASLDQDAPERNILDAVPFLTVGIMFCLMVIFGLERRLAFDIGKDGSLSLQSLLAFGAVSYDLAVASGEVWRIFLAPLLHASHSHVIGNVIALFFAGVRLEPLIGRAWLAALFVLSGIGGVVGSMLGNDSSIPSVGASGAITGLIGALFIVSFSPKADPEEQHSMRKVSLFFGIPALAPLLWGASGSTDYFCHLGGAIVGCVLAIVLCLQDHGPNEPRPGEKYAMYGSLACLAVSLGACLFVASGFAAHAQKAAVLIPAAMVPDNLIADDRRSAWFVERYPKDPRSYLIRGVFLAGKNKNAAAEEAFRTAVRISKSDRDSLMIGKVAQTGLALVVAEQGRMSEAKSLASEFCRAGVADPRRKLLAKAKLCD